MATEEKLETTVTVGVVRFSYAHVHEAVVIGNKVGAQPKYSVSLIIKKSDTKTIEKIKKAIENAKTNGKAILKNKWLPSYKNPLRDGDLERAEDAAYKNCYFLNANSTTKPGLLDKNKSPILVKEDFYSGCYGWANLNFYAFDKGGGTGIAAGLNHLMKTKDGEPLTQRMTADEAFESVEVDDDEEDFI